MLLKSTPKKLRERKWSELFSLRILSGIQALVTMVINLRVP
jgi:hypothetical protein